MIRYALPGISEYLSFNILFSRMMRSAPEMFFDDIKVESIYGNIPQCIMNGGRVVNGERYSFGQINKVFDEIESEGLIIRLTFTNMFIRKEQFDDEYSNLILKAAEGRNAQIIVYSDELGDYIFNRYHLKLILSTTRALDGVEELNRMLKRYYMVVLDYNHNQDDAFLRQVIDPSRLEVMVNELCKPNCPDRQKHYESNSHSQIEHVSHRFFCSGECESFGFTTRFENNYKHILSNEDIRRLNNTYGITHFKLVGRGGSIRYHLESYLYYLVKPEYRGTVLKILNKKLLKAENSINT